MSLCRLSPGRTRCIFFLAVGLAVGLGGELVPHATALGQTAIQAAMERQGPISPEKRAALYDQLRSQAEVLQKQAAVVKTVAKLIGPAVVHVEADVSSRIAPQHRRRHEEEIGSGVLIEQNGGHFVLTNRHVIAGTPSEAVKIILADGRQINPEKVWDDPETDIAVMAVSASNLVAARVGDSDRVEIGDFVLAVGSPFGLKHTVTFGIISAKGRRDLGLGSSGVRLQDFLQTDAAINPGSSGGPLVNLQGEVIGINTAIASDSGVDEGIAFAIPVNMFMFFARQLIEHGKVSRAFLGVTLDSSFGPAMAAEVGLPCPVGARVSEIIPHSPAAAANLQPGDVILEFDHVPVEDDGHLVNMVSLTEIGKEVPLVIFREREPTVVKIAVGDRSQFPLDR